MPPETNRLTQDTWLRAGAKFPPKTVTPDGCNFPLGPRQCAVAAVLSAHQGQTIDTRSIARAAGLPTRWTREILVRLSERGLVRQTLPGSQGQRRPAQWIKVKSNEQPISRRSTTLRPHEGIFTTR